METTSHNLDFLKRLAHLRHDLKTSAGHIMGYSEIIEEELQDEGIEEFVPSFQLLRAQGKHLVELIDEWLGASRVNVDELDLAGVRDQIEPCLQTIRETATGLLEEIDEEWQNDLEKIIKAQMAFQKLLDKELNREYLAAGESEEEANFSQS